MMDPPCTKTNKSVITRSQRISVGKTGVWYFIRITSEREFVELKCSILSIVQDTNHNDERIISVSEKFKNITVYRAANIRLHDDRIEIISIK
jgi:hypothetical protein